MNSREELSKSIKKRIAISETKKGLVSFVESFKNDEEKRELEELAQMLTSDEDIQEVIVHCHRPTMFIDIGKLDCLEDLSDEDKNFLKRASNSLKISAFNEAEKKIKSIESSVRIRLKNCSMGACTNMMHKDIFEENFFPFFMKKKKELDDVKDYISHTYNESLASFKHDVLSLVRKICPEREKDVMRDVNWFVSRSEADFLSRISLDLKTDFFDKPSDNLSNEEVLAYIEQAKKARNLMFVSSVVSGNIQYLWKEGIRYLYNVRDSKEDLTSKKSFRQNMYDAAKKVCGENVSGYPLFVNVCNIYKDVSKEIVKNSAEEKVLIGMAMLYEDGIKKGIQMELGKECPEWLTMDIIESVCEDLKNEQE